MSGVLPNPTPIDLATPTVSLEQATGTPRPTEAQSTAVPTSTPALLTRTPIAGKTPVGEAQATRPVGCNLATAGRPIDVTISDNTRIHSGDAFMKTWRLVNAGSCAWTKAYTLVWFSGEDLAFRKELPFRDTILPGQSVDLSVDMVAPQKPGLYQSNWKLRDENGELFGIGPNAGSPFWVRIEVIDPAVEAGTPFATRTPIPVIFSSGSAPLAIGQSYDLDEVSAGPAAGDDFFLRLTHDTIEIVPQNGARLALADKRAPDFADCNEAITLNSPLILGTEAQNAYLCVRTDRGLPASIFVARVIPQTSVDIHFTVWANP